MTRSQSAQSAMTEMFKQTQEIIGFNPMVGPQVEHFWEAQDEILKETEAFTRHWFQRRHDATRTALGIAKGIAMSGVADPAKTTKALAEWQTHSIERVAEDFREWFDMWSRCAGHLTRAEMEASEEGIEKATKRAKSMTKTKGAVPV